MPSMWRILELSAPLAFGLSLLLLWLYLRSVRRSMQRSATSTADPHTASPNRTPDATLADHPPRLRLEIGPTEQPSTAAIGAAWRGPLETAAVHVVAGLAYAVTLTLAWTTAIADPVPWQGIAIGTLTAIWPVVIVVGLVATVSWRTMALMLLAYTAVFVGAVVLMQQGGEPGWNAIARSWWAGPGIATLVVLVFLARPIRAMGLLILVLTMAAWGGVFAINEVLDKTNAIEHIVGALPEITSKSSTYLATGVLALVFWGIPATIAAVACYLALRGLGRLYRARWFSDQQLQIDAVWLIFTLAYGWSVLPIGGLLAFIAYKLVATAGLRLIARTTPPDESATRLLLLRVFSLGVRSSRLFEGFARQWRYRGSMRMIAGPDLANATVEPHEFLDFLAGLLDRRFIDGPRMLEQRLAEALPQRDPDGRFRVTSFFCHDDTWRMVLAAARSPKRCRDDGPARILSAAPGLHLRARRAAGHCAAPPRRAGSRQHDRAGLLARGAAQQLGEDRCGITEPRRSCAADPLVCARPTR